MAELNESTDVRDLVRERYAAAVEASLGCGVPTAVADLRDGETVLVDFVKGHIEHVPLSDSTVGAVISNCVINLSAATPREIRPTHRVHPHAVSAVIRARTPSRTDGTS